MSYEMQRIAKIYKDRDNDKKWWVELERKGISGIGTYVGFEKKDFLAESWREVSKEVNKFFKQKWEGKRPKVGVYE